MSRRRRYSIKHPGSFKPGASRNARNISNIEDSLVDEKKKRVRQLIQDLKSSEVITDFRITRNSKRALYFEVDVIKENINKKNIQLQFIIWTDNKSKPNNWTSSNSARFFLRIHEDIKEKVLGYLEGIEKGLTTEYLGMLILERLERKRAFRRFRKAKMKEDKKEGKDYILIIVIDGREMELPIQFKSSFEELMKHKERFPNIPGLYREFRGDRTRQEEIIEEKIILIIAAFKKGRIICI